MKPIKNKIQVYYRNKEFGVGVEIRTGIGFGSGNAEIYNRLNKNEKIPMYNKTDNLREIFWQMCDLRYATS